MDLCLVAAGKVKTLLKVNSSSEAPSKPSDAFCTSTAGLGALGIASGFMGQPEFEAPYAPALMSNCASVFATANGPKPGNPSAKPYAIDPAYILAHAQQATCLPGTAAVALAALQPGSKLCITNLGDCRVLLLRDGVVWNETEEQLHSEVFAGVRKPFQLGHPSLAQGSDSIHDAARYLWDVREGDIIVAGTNAFFSNIKRSILIPTTLKTLTGASNLPNPKAGTSSGLPGLKRVASAVCHHTSGGGAIDPGIAQPAPASSAVASPLSSNSSSSSSPNVSRGSSPEPKLDSIAEAAAHAADLLATAAAERLAKKKTKAAAAAAAAEVAAAAAASNGNSKGSLLSRLEKQPKPPAKQPLACNLKDDIACVVAVVSVNSCSTAAVAVTTTISAAATADPAIVVSTDDSTHTAADNSCIEPAEGSEPLHCKTNTFAAPASVAADSMKMDNSSSSSSSPYRDPSEAGSTSQLFSSPSVKGPRFSKVECEIIPTSSDHIRIYHRATGLRAHSAKNLIPAVWMGPELGDSPSKLELPRRRSAAERLLSAAAEHQSAAAAARLRSESPTGSYAGRQLLRIRSMQTSYSNQRQPEPHYRSNQGTHRLPPTQQSLQYRSRRATVGGSSSSSNSYRTSSNRSDGGASYSSHMQGYSSSSRRSEVLSSSRSSSSSNLTALMGLPPTPASTSSRVSSGSGLPHAPRPALAPVDPATAVPAGMDKQGQRLYVGCPVVIESEAGVAAVGTVKLVTGQQLNKWEPEKVSPGHVGVGDMSIHPSMESAARSTRFWVKCESFKLYGNHPDYTFWTRKTALESGISVSIPCSCLKLVE